MALPYEQWEWWQRVGELWNEGKIGAGVVAELCPACYLFIPSVDVLKLQGRASIKEACQCEGQEPTAGEELYRRHGLGDLWKMVGAVPAVTVEEIGASHA